MDDFDYDLMWNEEKPFADRLAVWIKHNLNPFTIIDMGCGPGMYVAALREIGLREVFGYDIDKRVANREAEGLFKESIFDVSHPADVVLCIEVAEHIPQIRELDIAAAIARNTIMGGTLIWSAAHPGQGGVGHINCQPKEHWEKLLSHEGMRRDFRRENHMLNWIRSGYHMGWFSMNAMVFIRGLVK